MPQTTVLDDIAQAIGFAATLSLWAHYAGTDLWVPTIARPDHPLAADHVLGRLAFRRLVDGWPGERIVVPDISQLLIVRRHLALARDLQEGVPAAVAARRHGVTERTAFRALALYRTLGENFGTGEVSGDPPPVPEWGPRAPRGRPIGSTR